MQEGEEVSRAASSLWFRDPGWCRLCHPQLSRGYAYSIQEEIRAWRSPTKFYEQLKKWHRFCGHSISEVSHMVPPSCTECGSGLRSHVLVTSLPREREHEFWGTTICLCHKSQEKLSSNSQSRWWDKYTLLALRWHKETRAWKWIVPRDSPPDPTPAPPALKTLGSSREHGSPSLRPGMYVCGKNCSLWDMKRVSCSLFLSI